MSQRERDVCYQSAVRFCEKNPAAILEICDEDDIREKREKRTVEVRVEGICNGNSALTERVEGFAKKLGLSDDASKLNEFLVLLEQVRSKGRGSSDGGSTAASSSSKTPEVDTNICCFATGKLYTEAMLGVGVSREKKNLATAAELLSRAAYKDGLRQNTNKSSFEFFLPVWINTQHASASQEWKTALRESYLTIGQNALSSWSENHCILEVFPRLINQMIVEIMKPDAGKSEAIATFEALCNFWRTFRWLVDSLAPLKEKIRKTLTSFVSDETFRHKDTTPDLGMILVMYTVLQGHDGCPSRQQFVDAYVDENALRWVMWWQRSGTPVADGPVFEATKVSREIFLFQLMVVDVVIGDVAETLKDIERTNCKLPDRLEKLQALWRERKSTTKDWKTFFQHAGATRPNHASSVAWIQDCVQRVAAKGPKYGGSKGEGKGSGKGGKGKGKSGKGGY
eukprot:TRINITY_DN1079_c0_g1_i16.p1 TRINITY_DN1079_c0_g1~~TRINITY_DN1079_c0_g1_i16.p1  ORF type:complete len:475 (-),score=94.06 TRINITY_DN1079_c0_g1_i16:291-1652(-)